MPSDKINKLWDHVQQERFSKGGTYTVAILALFGLANGDSGELAALIALKEAISQIKALEAKLAEK